MKAPMCTVKHTKHLMKAAQAAKMSRQCAQVPTPLL